MVISLVSECIDGRLTLNGEGQKLNVGAIFGPHSSAELDPDILASVHFPTAKTFLPKPFSLL